MFKKPSEKLITLVNNFAEKYGSATEIALQMKQQAEIEQVPKDQLIQLIKTALKNRGLTDRTIRRALPPDLKNQNMTRAQPKKDPLVKQWKIKFNIPRMWEALKPLYEAKHMEGYIVHDNVRVVDVEYV